MIVLIFLVIFISKPVILAEGPIDNYDENERYPFPANNEQ